MGLVRRARRFQVAGRILWKWGKDSRVLPLNRHHASLYYRLHAHSWRELGRFPELADPVGFNDRVQWLKLFDQTPLQPRLVDKFRVRDHVAELVGPQYLNIVHAVLDRAEDLASICLPDAFVLKATHDSGSVRVVPDVTQFDLGEAIVHFDIRLRSKFGHVSGEWPYPLVRPRLIVEELIVGPKNGDLADYKFHCVNGAVRFVQIISNRFTGAVETLVDREGRVLPFNLHEEFAPASPDSFRHPATWTEMISVAERLAADWRYVRVDLYSSSAGVRFGEMTFHPYAGCYRGEGELRLGDEMTFDLRRCTPPLTPQDCSRIRRAT